MTPSQRLQFVRLPQLQLVRSLHDVAIQKAGLAEAAVAGDFTEKYARIVAGYEMRG